MKNDYLAQLSGVRKRCGATVVALDGLDLQVKPGGLEEVFYPTKVP